MGIVIEARDEGDLGRIRELLLSRKWVKKGGYYVKDVGPYYWVAEELGLMVLFNCGLEEYSLEALHRCVDELRIEVEELVGALGIPIDVDKLELTL